MANVEAFVNHAMEVIEGLPAFAAAGLTRNDIGRRFRPQTVEPRPENYPAVAVIYDFDDREIWAPIDKINLVIQIDMKRFEQASALSLAIRDVLHDYKTVVDGVFVLYGCFHRGGTPQPIYNSKSNTYEVLMTFESRLG